MKPIAKSIGTVRGTPQGALWLATLGFFGGFAGVAVFGPQVPRFQELLALSPVAAALLAAIPNLTGALLRIPFGAAVDRFGGRRPMLTLLSITIAGMAGLIALLATAYPRHLSGMYPLLLVLGVLIGCGIACFSVGIAQVSYWFPKREQGGALGTFGGLGNISPAVSTVLLPFAIVAFGIIGAYSVWLAILVAITIVYAVMIHDAPVFQLRKHGVTIESAPSDTVTAGLRQASRVPATWMLVTFYFLSFGGFLALTAWLPSYWHAMYGAPLGVAGMLTASFTIVCALVRVAGGVASDRLPIRFALAGNFLLMFFGLVTVGLSSHLIISLAGTIAIAVGMGLQNAVVFKLVPIYVPGAVGGASGLVGGIGALGGFVLPPMMGLVTGLIGGPTGYARGFLPVAVLVLFALPLVAMLGRWNRSHHVELGEIAA